MIRRTFYDHAVVMQKVQPLIDSGLSRRVIAEKVGINYGTLTNIIVRTETAKIEQMKNEVRRQKEARRQMEQEIITSVFA